MWRLSGLGDVLKSLRALVQVSLQMQIVLLSLHHLHGVVCFHLLHLCSQVLQLRDSSRTDTLSQKILFVR